MNQTKNDSVLKVLFPTDVLNPSIALLNPSDTETISEYYLLENLSCGLVRDSATAPTGYEGCIAKRFYQPDPASWIFELNFIKWSDGQDVSENEIKNWIGSLIDGCCRHIQFLRRSSSFEYNHEKRILKINFPFAVDEIILHELSLADAGLFPTDYRVNGWAKSVGPYVVDSWEPSKKELTLRENAHSPLYREDMPKKALLMPLKDPKLRTEIFSSLGFNVVRLDAIVGPTRATQVLSSAPAIFNTHPTSIVFFVLNRGNADAQEFSNRNQFAEVIGQLRKKIPSFIDQVSTFQDESQLIPEGFQGRLTEPYIAEQVVGNLKKIEIFSTNLVL